VTEERLGLKTDIGGIARFEGDVYHLKGGNVPGNPWFIATLWLAQYYCEFLKNENDIAEYVKRFGWVVKYATKSGVLSEQIDAYTGEQLSAAPLTWSHAEFVISIIDYLEKLEELGICEACYPVK
jgi:GH15 family glucan-1,4-alpha-glucosidase